LEIDPSRFARGMRYVRVVKYFMRREFILNAITNEQIERLRKYEAILQRDRGFLLRRRRFHRKGTWKIV